MKLSLSILALVSADARLRRESVIVGDDGKWNKCEAQLSDMDVNGEIKCEAEVCSVLCMPGFMVEGPAKAKCVKGKDGEWSFNKELGVCVEAEDDMEDMEDKPEKPDMEDHEDEMDEDKPEDDYEEKPEDYEDKPEDHEDKPDKPEEDDGDMYDDEEKPMCEEGEDCEEKPDMDGEKPDMEDMPDVFGDEGKWTKCEPEPVDMGKLKCEADKCMLYCMEGFMVEGNDKAKCEKNKNGKWKFNKEFGMCVECGDDCPEVEMPDMEKPDHEDEEKPMCEEGEDCEDMEAEKPEKPMCDDEDEDCEEKPDHDEEPMCEEGEDCEEKPEKPMCDEDEDCEEMEKPDCEEGEDCEEMEGEKPDMDGEDCEEKPEKPMC